MSDSRAPAELVAKPIDAGVRRTTTRLSLMAAVFLALVVCNGAMAQVDDTEPTPTIGATSPLGMGIGSVSLPTGIPLGSTEITSAGVSPAPTGLAGTISIPTTTSATACSTVATSPSQMFGSSAMYDGGGTTPGASTPATAVDPGMLAIPGVPTPSDAGTSTSPAMSTSSGMLDTSGTSGMCGSGSSSVAASSSPTSTSPITPGGAARTGIPFGSYEIGNLGVSSTPAVPLPTVSPTASTLGLGSSMPTLPSLMPSTGTAATSPATATNPACATSGAPGIFGSIAGGANAGITGVTTPEQRLSQFLLCEGSSS